MRSPDSTFNRWLEPQYRRRNSIKSELLNNSLNCQAGLDAIALLLDSVVGTKGSFEDDAFRLFFLNLFDFCRSFRFLWASSLQDFLYASHSDSKLSNSNLITSLENVSTPILLPKRVSVD